MSMSQNYLEMQNRYIIIWHLFKTPAFKKMIQFTVHETKKEISFKI